MNRANNLLHTNGSNSKPPVDEGKEECKDPDQILSLPYPLLARSRQFKKKYMDSIGYTIQAEHLDDVHLRMSLLPLCRALQLLGFKRVEESMADCIVPDENKVNWTILTSKDTANTLSDPSYVTMKPFVHRMYLLCNKWFLVQSLSNAELRMRKRKESFLTGLRKEFNHLEFTPFTINMNSRTLEADLVKRPGTYLAKPSRGSMGEHMQLARIRGNHVQEDLLNFLLGSEYQDMRRSQIILQQYIERPLLIDKRKFDMRVYMLVVNPKRGNDTLERPRQSGYFSFLHPGFVRLCSAPYDPNHSDIAVHLTNQSIQAKNAETFKRLKEVTTWYPDELNDYLNKRRRIQQHDWAKDVLYPKVGAVLGYISAVYRNHLDDHECTNCTFRILGVDMLVDDDLRLYLLEFNELPAWGRQTSVLECIKPNLWREAICLVSEVTARYKAYLAVSDNRLVTRQNFSLTYSSEEPDLARRNVARLY